jgi:hypothetical protein
MGLIGSITREVDRYTDKSNWPGLGKRGIKVYELESFYDAVEQRAYFAAETDNHQRPEDSYWHAAKASVALEITGKLDSIFNSYNPRPAVLPLDEQDSELISLVLSLPGVQKNLHKHIGGRVMDSIKESWNVWLEGRTR